jgi:hypothetical protein
MQRDENPVDNDYLAAKLAELDANPADFVCAKCWWYRCWSVGSDGSVYVAVVLHQVLKPGSKKSKRKAAASGKAKKTQTLSLSDLLSAPSSTSTPATAATTTASGSSIKTEIFDDIPAQAFDDDDVKDWTETKPCTTTTTTTPTSKACSSTSTLHNLDKKHTTTSAASTNASRATATANPIKRYNSGGNSSSFAHPTNAHPPQFTGASIKHGKPITTSNSHCLQDGKLSFYLLDACEEFNLPGSAFLFGKVWREHTHTHTHMTDTLSVSLSLHSCAQ